jgi:hypothetical protein
MRKRQLLPDGRGRVEVEEALADRIIDMLNEEAIEDSHVAIGVCLTAMQCILIGIRCPRCRRETLEKLRASLFPDMFEELVTDGALRESYEAYCASHLS